MSTLRTWIRRVPWIDLIVVGLLIAMTVFLMNHLISSPTGTYGPTPENPDGYRLDSNSPWLMTLAVLPLAIFWWRRSALRVTAVITAGYAAHVLAFGWATRCGSGLPMLFVLAFLIGLRHKGRELWLGYGAALVFNAVVLIRDDQAGIGILPVTGIMALGLLGVGKLTQSRVEMGRQLKAHNEELRVLRDQRAALEVTGDRARLSVELDDLLDRHLARLDDTARAAQLASDPAEKRVLLEAIEIESRSTLGRMREIVGTLRGSEQAVLSPAPSVDHLDALLARHGGTRVQVVGDPRRLPASVELSAYRIVEHLLGVLESEGRSPLEVRMAFADDALEIRVAGPVGKGPAVREAIARAKERASLQEGSLSVRVARGRARAVAQLPVRA